MEENFVEEVAREINKAYSDGQRDILISLLNTFKRIEEECKVDVSIKTAINIIEYALNSEPRENVYEKER